MLSSHHNYLLEVWLRQCVFCKVSLLSWSSCKCRNVGPSGSEFFVLCLPDTTFLSGSEADSREELAGASLCAGTLLSTRFSVNSSNHSGRSRNTSPRACWNWLRIVSRPYLTYPFVLFAKPVFVQLFVVREEIRIFYTTSSEFITTTVSIHAAGRVLRRMFASELVWWYVNPFF